MNLPKLLVYSYSIQDLNDDFSLAYPRSTKELRSKVETLIIDDEDLILEDYLRKNGFNISHKKDIESIKDVAEYAIILCDIRDVGKALGATMEGAFLVREIKNNYPNKQVVAYTGSAYDASFNNYMSYADDVISKGLPVDDWVSLLDRQIELSVNPIHQWEILRKYLLEKNMSTAFIAKLEDKYVRCIKKKDFKELAQLSQSNGEAHEIISEFISSVCAKLILGVFG